MGAYVAKRLFLLIFTSFGVLVITFFISHVVPGDPIGAVLAPQAPPDLVEKIRAKWGFDKPIYEQFVLYVNNIFHGDLGTSIRTNNPVFEDLISFFPATLELATTAMIIGVILGVSIGIISAVKQGRMMDHVVRVFSLIGLSMPVYWLGLILLLIFYYVLGWLPGPGQLDYYMIRPPKVTGLITIDSLIASDLGAFVNALKHLLLPAFVLGYFSTAAIARITRASMLEVLRQEYVRTARMKGLRETIVIMKHALKNAMLPITTIIGISYGSLLEGAVLTETIFAWPGLGRYATSAFLSLDFPAVMGVTLLIALIYALVNLFVDLLYAFLNPKIRYG
jgi:peptide/nickel transport system permease protein